MKLAFIIVGIALCTVGIVLFFAEITWGTLIAGFGSLVTALGVREYVRDRRANKR